MMKFSSSLATLKELAIAVAGLLSLSVAARAAISVDATIAFNNTSSPVFGTFNASGSDKLVVIVTGEHGFNNDQGNCNSVTHSRQLKA